MCAQTNRHTLQLALCGGGGCGGIFLCGGIIYIDIKSFTLDYGERELHLRIGREPSLCPSTRRVVVGNVGIIEGSGS